MSDYEPDEIVGELRRVRRSLGDAAADHIESQAAELAALRAELAETKGAWERDHNGANDLIGRLRREAENHQERWRIVGPQIEQLRATAERYKADAERYQWLRTPQRGDEPVVMCADRELYGEALDAAIDAARQSQLKG